MIAWAREAPRRRIATARIGPTGAWGCQDRHRAYGVVRKERVGDQALASPAVFQERTRQ